MRRLVLLLLAVTTLSFSANASVTLGEFFKAVINSEALTEATGTGELKAVKHSLSYRCPGCYQFVVEVVHFDAAGTPSIKKHTFMTTMDLSTQAISVSAEKN